jgi:transcriptional regulator with XRE-family HTH domain
LELEQAFGEVLREQRRSIGMSQEELALEAGIERNYVSLLERGLNSPSLRMLFKLCAALQTKPSAMLVDVERRQHGPKKKSPSPLPIPSAARKKGA